MRVLRKIMALTLALTLVLSVGAMTAVAAGGGGILARAQTIGAGPSNITLGVSSLTLTVGGTGTITATIPAGASNVKWESSDDGKATVKASDQGNSARVTGVAAGTAIITVNADGATPATCTVTVEAAVDKTALTTAITAANTNKDSAKVSANGTDVVPAEKWVTQAVKDAYTTAIAAAQAIKDKANATQAEVDGAVTKLAAATTTFNTAKADGTKPSPSSSAKLITGFMIADSNSKVDESNHTIAVGVPYSTDVTKLTPTITISEKASVSPASEETQDFTNPVTYTVTAEDGSTQKYVVTVTKWADPAADQKAVKSEADKIKSITAPAKDATKLNLPSVGADFTVAITYSSNTHVIALDGTIIPPAKAETVALVLTVTYTGKDVTANTDAIKVLVPAKSSGGATGGDGSSPAPNENTANKPETTEKVNDTIAALKDPTKEMPKEAVKTTTAGGASITTIPVAMTSGSASMGTDIFNTIGSASANVGLKLTVSNGMGGGSMEVIIPGGFGKITEPGRISFPMDYSATAEHSSTMTAAVKGDNAVSMTAKVGGNFTLPVAATVTVPTKLANGSTVNIYKYDPITNKLIAIGKAIVKDGKLTFATKIMGEMLFTTGTV